MPSKPLRPCRAPNCTELVPGGYCQKHKPKSGYDRSKEAAEWHKLYRLKIWTLKLRPNQLAREPWCRSCAAHGIRTKATVVDHIVPHRGNMALFSSASNLQSLCKNCHDTKTALETHERQGTKL